MEPNHTTLRRQALGAQRATLLQYLRAKLDADDLHGVQDAASDLRELDARVDELERVAREWPSGPPAMRAESSSCGERVATGACMLPVGHVGAHQNVEGWTRAE